MSAARLTIVRPGAPHPPAQPGEEVVSLDEFWGWVKTGRLVARPGRYGAVRILVARLESAGRPLPLALAARVASRGPIFLEDAHGRHRDLDAATLARWSASIATEPFRVRALLDRQARAADALARLPRSAAPLDLTRPVLYLRTDLSFGVRAGGSVGHIAGVLNQLAARGPAPIFLTTDDVPTVRREVETVLVPPAEAFWNFAELPTLPLNDAFIEAARARVGTRPIAFVYQRYSLNNFAGLAIARDRGVPLVLEYNGSEVWMARHWSRPLKHEAIASHIEHVNLSAADLLVVVSRAMRDQIVERGLPADRVMVNPNGVDPETYSDRVDGARVRRALGLEGARVVGFIGTFGPWHGAEVLAEAFVRRVAAAPALARDARLLLIGSGARLEPTRSILESAGLAERVVCTGMVPQAEGPEHLAACDVVVSPQVANPDGTPFFGSPTKVFEYMALGKAIVASNLDQIGEVLEHGRTAWLVTPGDSAALAAGLRRLLDDDELRRRLGSAARCEVLAHHTWERHVDRLMNRLRDTAIR